MADFASKELAVELYELSGWWDNDENGRVPGEPYYCLGYLLRKLPFPKVYQLETNWDGKKDIEASNLTQWYAEYNESDYLVIEKADTPEDCTAQLCIQLIKQNILVVNKGGL